MLKSEVLKLKNNIKSVREQRNMTQKDCADTLGITLRAWQTYEQGVSEPKQELLCKIADMFNVSIDYLLGRETGEPETIDKLVGEFNMSALEKEILDNYLSLPSDMRCDLMEFLQKSVRKVMDESGE
nr:MAG TPA: Repressor protein CI [Caudoviricetes sp.]